MESTQNMLPYGMLTTAEDHGGRACVHACVCIDNVYRGSIDSWFPQLSNHTRALAYRLTCNGTV